MEAAQTSSRSLGEIFVERGLISEADLERALAEQETTKRRLADILVRRGLVTGHDITSALMEQLGETPMHATAIAAVTPSPTTAPTLTAVEPEPVADVARERWPESEVVQPDDKPIGHAEAKATTKPAPEPILATTPAPEVELSVSVRALIAEADSRRRGAEAELTAAREAHAQVVQDLEQVRAELEARDLSTASLTRDVLRGLEQVRAELEARDLSTARLTREVEEAQLCLRNREDELTNEVASWEAAGREAERCGGQLAELQTRFEEKAHALSEASASAAAWTARADELESETTVLADRVGAAAHALEQLAATRFAANGTDAGRPSTTNGLKTTGSTASGVLYFVPNAKRYDLVEREGDLPSVGTAMEVEGQEFVVTKVGRSPLPFDRRKCVFLTAV
jgi:hypothetical protein